MAGLTLCRSGRCGLLYQEYNPWAVGGPQSELKSVVDSQKKEDNVEFGSKFPPRDLSVIASISSGRTFGATASTLSFQSKKSTRMGRSLITGVEQTHTHHYVVNSSNDLTEGNLSVLQHYIAGLPLRNKIDVDSSGLRPVQSTPSQADRHGGSSPMIEWLNHSAFPEFGIRPPILISEDGDDEHEGADEEDEIEILRRVCIPQAMPASKHYLDVPEFAGIGIRTMPYLRKIIDRFPKVPPYIARRLAEKNLTRSERLTKVRRTAFKTQYDDWQLDQLGKRSRERHDLNLKRKQNQQAQHDEYGSEEDNDDENISGFLRMLEQRKSILTPKSSAAATAGTKRTAAALARFHRMRNTDAAL